MTSTLPWRRMILHLSHIFLTEGRTFIINLPFGMCVSFYSHTQPQVMVFFVFPAVAQRPAPGFSFVVFSADKVSRAQNLHVIPNLVNVVSAPT